MKKVYKSLTKKVFKMVIVKIMHMRVMFMIVYSYTFLVGTNAPISNRETYQCCCHVYSAKGSYTFRLGVLPDDHGRSEQGHWTVTGWLKYSFDGHESAAVRKPHCTLLSKVFSFSQGKDCKMCGARLDTEHVKVLIVSVKFKACAQMKRNVPGTLIPRQSTCLQFYREIFCLLDGFSVSVDITIKVNLTTDASSEDSSLSSVDCTHQEECISSNCLQDEVTFSIHRIVDNSTMGLCIADCKGFLYFPGLHRLLSHSLMFNQSSFNQWLHFSINTVLCFIYNVIYMLLVTLVILYKYTRENNATNDITIVFVKWYWNGKRQTQKCFGLRIARNQTVYCGFKQSRAILFQDEISKLSILSEYIFLPWHSKFEEENSKLSFYHSRHDDYHFLNDTHFSKCHPYISNFHFPDSFQTIHVNPVTRFLPDPTFTPDVDMSYVGYRLATLGALPSSVPVSRVRLAEAGFYFRGHNEEVTCYSCHMRYSNWSRSDDPMDIHRDLSPRCEHVLARDRELANLTSGNNQGDARRRSSQRSAVLSSSPEDSHAGDNPAEDSEHSEAQTPNESPVQNSIITQSTNASHNEAGNLQGPVTGLTSLSPSTGAVRTISSGSPPVLTTASANANAVARSVTNVQSTTDLTASSGSGAIRSSSQESSPHLYPRARLDVGGAVYPMYHTMASRRSSFTSVWDETRAPPLDEVILCGMFYAGYADCVRCFFCGVGLKNWVVTDNVWIEHVRWRAACGYLRAVKGDDFIRAMQRQLGTSNSTGDGAHSGSHGLAQAQGIDSESPQHSAALPVTSTQTQPTPATVRVSSSGDTSGTDTTSTTPTSITSSAAASPGTPQASGEEAARPSRTSRPDPAAAPSSSAGSGDGAEGQRRCGGERLMVGREERRRGEASVSEVSGNESAEEDRPQAENRQLSELFRCRVCLQAAVDTILMPCGHLVICSACAASVTSCPLCQQSIQATARVYLEN